MSTRHQMTIRVQAVQVSGRRDHKVVANLLIRGAWLQGIQDLGKDPEGFLLNADTIAQALKGRKRVDRNGILVWEPKA